MTAPSPARSRLEAIASQSPELSPWLALVDIVLAEIAEPTWSVATPERPSASERPSAPAPGAPRLAGARISISPGILRRFLVRLFEAAARGAPPAAAAALRSAARADALDPLPLLEAAINHDAPRLESLSRALALDPAALAPIAHLAATPLLQTCRGALTSALPPPWPHGHCPICGAWPTLAESRGLDRARRLRCGRCGADWPAPPLSCAFCGERDHEKLLALQPDQSGESRKAEACTTCHGFLKSITTLTAWPGETVLLEDLATIDLDIAALDRGYARPEDPGHSLNVRLAPAAEPRWSLRRLFP